MFDQLNDQLIETSKCFWDAMEHADEAGMRAIADPACTFVHIGITAPLDQEIEFYTSGTFKPTNILFHNQTPSVLATPAWSSPTATTRCCSTDRRPRTTSP